MSYVSKYDKSLACFLSSFAAYLEQELDDPKSSIHRSERKARCMMTYCASMIRDVLRDTNEEQRELIAKQCSVQRLVLTFQEDRRIKEALNIIPTDALNLLVKNAFQECFMCDKTHQAARDCPLRSALLRAGAEAHEVPKGVCPFRHGDL